MIYGKKEMRRSVEYAFTTARIMVMGIDDGEPKAENREPTPKLSNL